jgi:hypothetical protein
MEIKVVANEKKGLGIRRILFVGLLQDDSNESIVDARTPSDLFFGLLNFLREI